MRPLFAPASERDPLLPVVNPLQPVPQQPLYARLMQLLVLAHLFLALDVFVPPIWLLSVPVVEPLLPLPVLIPLQPAHQEQLYARLVRLFVPAPLFLTLDVFVPQMRPLFAPASERDPLLPVLIPLQPAPQEQLPARPMRLFLPAPLAPVLAVFLLPLVLRLVPVPERLPLLPDVISLQPAPQEQLFARPMRLFLPAPLFLTLDVFLPPKRLLSVPIPECTRFLPELVPLPFEPQD